MTIATDTIQYSNSKELFQHNGLKEWKGFTVTRQLREGESILDAAKGLIAEMDELHGLYGGNIRVDYSAIPGHPMYQEKEEEDLPLTKEQALIKLINEDCKTLSLLERQRGQVERMNDPIVTDAFNFKMKNLKGEHN